MKRLLASSGILAVVRCNDAAGCGQRNFAREVTVVSPTVRLDFENHGEK